MASLLRARPLLARARFASPLLDRLARGLLDLSWPSTFAALLLAMNPLPRTSSQLAPHTPIDWRAYMQEVEAVVVGVWDYAELRGETGPLAYPGGFVWLFAGLVPFPAATAATCARRSAFAAAYVATHALVFAVYARARPAGMPPWVAAPLCASKAALAVRAAPLQRLLGDPAALRRRPRLQPPAVGGGLRAVLVRCRREGQLTLRAGAAAAAPQGGRAALRRCCRAARRSSCPALLRANPRAYLIGGLAARPQAQVDGQLEVPAEGVCAAAPRAPPARPARSRRGGGARRRYARGAARRGRSTPSTSSASC